MVDPPKILYIVVVDEEERGFYGDEGGAFRYTRPVLQSTLQLMGCKPRHAFKISRTVFDVMRNECKKDGSIHAVADLAGSDTSSRRSGRESRCGLLNRNKTNETIDISSIQFELYKRQTTVIVAREIFLSMVCDALSAYKYVGPNQKIDLLLACRIRERKESVTILLCGTSGCGKSTLSVLLGSRLGITTVISTDSIRHMMRSFVDEKENPLLWSSTYHAGEFLDPTAVAEAKAKRKAKRLVPSSEKHGNQSLDAADSSGFQAIGKTQMAVEGFKAQSEMVIDSLDRLITAWEDQKQSVIVEGVHLSLNFVMGLMKRHRSIIPFMIHIAREDKHVERFAVRAKYMTLDPSKNKYVKYIRNIRRIQEYLCNRADKHLVPKINNTNVDRSVAAIHATVFSCLRRREAGEQLYDPTTNTVPVVQQEHRSQCAANSLSSKRMFQLIQRLGSSRHLMALVNTDGSVAKAWPVEPVESCAGSPVYGPLKIGKAEPINLQFGNYGISAWPNDAGSIGSCSSSPGHAGGALKEPMEEASVSGSEDEEAIQPRGAESEEDDPSDIEPESVHEEMEGSVDEESIGSDEEYDDLAMKDDEYSSGERGPANPLLEEDECSRRMRRCRSHSDRNQRSKGERIRNQARILGRSRSIPASFAVPQARSGVGILRF